MEYPFTGTVILDVQIELLGLTFGGALAAPFKAEVLIANTRVLSRVLLLHGSENL